MFYTRHGATVVHPLATDDRCKQLPWEKNLRALFSFKLIRHLQAAWLEILLLGVLAVGAFLIATTPPSNPYDHPFYIITAGRILEGEKPYVDFGVVYGPLGYYINAIGLWPLQFLPIIKAFGVLNFLLFLVYLLLLVSAKRSLRDHPPFPALLVTGYLVGLFPILVHYAYYSLMPSLMLILAIQLSKTFLSPGCPSIWKYAGGLAALTVVATLTRINFGFYIFAGLASVVFLQLCWGYGRIWARVMAFFIMSLIFGGLALLLLYWAGILIPYLQDMMLFLPRYRARFLPLTYSTSPGQLMVLLQVFLILVAIGFDLVRRHILKAGMVGIVISLGLFQYCYQRLDINHVYVLFLVLPFVYIAIWEDYQSAQVTPLADGSVSGKLRPDLLRLLPWALIYLLLALPVIYSNSSMRIVQETASWWLNRGDSSAEREIGLLPGEKQMLDDLAREKGGRDIFWGSVPGSCESSTQTGANLSLYLAQGRLPSTRIWFFDPCSTAHDDVQQSLVQELEVKHLPLIAMQGLIDPTLGYLPGNPPESRILFDYVQRNYTLQKRYSLPEANRYYDIYVQNGAQPVIRN